MKSKPAKTPTDPELRKVFRSKEEYERFNEMVRRMVNPKKNDKG